MANANQSSKNALIDAAGVVLSPLASGAANPIPAGFPGVYADSNKIIQTVDSAGNISPLLGEEQTSVTADAAISLGQWVYASAANHVNLAQANAGTTLAIGVAPVAIANAAVGSIQSAGIFVTTGLTAGSVYYLSPSVAGSITSTIPATIGQFVQVVGIALSTTQLLMINSIEPVALGSSGTTGIDAGAAGAFTVGGTTATSIVLAQATSLAAGKALAPAATGGIAASVSGFTSWWTGNAGVALATSGNDTAVTNGDIYWAPIFLPHNATITGINYLIGSVGGTDKAIVGLYNSTGVLLASSALAGTIVGTAANFQPLDFTAPLAAVGPALYFAAVQFNGTTAKFRTHTAPGQKFVAATQAGVFGTMAAITPGTTYTANKGPIAVTY